MNDVAIRCEGLGKRYRIGERERYKALRDVITDAAASPFRKLRNAVIGKRQGASNGNGNGATSLTASPSPLSPPDGNGNSASSLITHDSSLLSHPPISDLGSPTSDLFWALKDVSFEVKRGEVVGIIGRNGAGKSTLLKILSRITAPTEGEVEVRGRVGSLLEVGTGFHPELTGRENIYLNGAILGMKRAEINRKFDEIVAFAEIENFIDTPVKRYSSGMYVRLAFAVAAHMETEILLVDEVLAVGDAQFQKKCLGKMGDVAKQGRTVLFVSHNMGAINQLCGTALMLQAGRISSYGETSIVISTYCGCVGDEIQFNRSRVQLRDSRFEVTDVYMLNASGVRTSSFNGMETVSIHVVGNVNQNVQCSLECVIKDFRKVPVTYHAQGHFMKMQKQLSRGPFHIVARIKQLRLASGRYSIDLSLTNTNVTGYVDMEDILDFDVELCDPCNVGFNYPSLWGRGSAVVDVSYEWL